MRSYIWVDGDEYCGRIQAFLEEIDEIMLPRLRGRVDIEKYAFKLSEKADTLFVVEDGIDIASCSIYCNKKEAFITSIAVKQQFMHRHIGTDMMKEIKQHAKEKECRAIQLKVHKENESALNFYKKNGFASKQKSGEWIAMECKLNY